MAGDNFLYDIYERRLAARIDPATVPHHVGVILDGNRRWARSMGFGAAQGHKRGADKIRSSSAGRSRWGSRSSPCGC